MVKLPYDPVKAEPTDPAVPEPSTEPVLIAVTVNVSLFASVSWCVPLDV